MQLITCLACEARTVRMGRSSPAAVRAARRAGAVQRSGRVGVREAMRNRHGVRVAVASLAIVGAGIAIFLQARDAGPRGPGDRYFSTDDGETFFVDDGRKLAPFDKDGK